MRSFMLITTMIILALSTSCTTTGDDLTSPATPELLNSENNLDSYVEECRANMRTIAGQAVIHFAINGTYPANMEEMGEPYSELTCPECGLPYEFFGNEKLYFLNCPLPNDPNHGFIDNGLPSWTGENPDPSEHQSICRANMRTIASQAVMFFASNNRYPDNLEEMGMSGYLCPTCGSTYIYSAYFNEETQEPGYFLSCPLPSDPNHGFIDNGVPSWSGEQSPHPEQWEDFCQANMRTIASQAVIFFAEHNKYPNCQEDIGMSGVVCPACGQEYLMIGTETEFYVSCPMPSDPNHGFIDNGIPSWTE